MYSTEFYPNVSNYSILRLTKSTSFQNLKSQNKMFNPWIPIFNNNILKL